MPTDYLAKDLDAVSAAHGGFGRALLFALIGFALGAGATFLAWRYNFLTLTAGAPEARRTTQMPAQRSGEPLADASSAPSDAKTAALRAAAVQGSARAQNDLGVVYQLGRGVEHSDAEALKWYRKAAERNFPLAQSNLGWMLENGRGVDKDPASAMFWYKLAAQGGDMNGQYNLALLYERGLGTARDRTLALEWYDKAARQGHAPARRAAAQVRAGLQQEAAAPDSATAPSAAGSVGTPIAAASSTDAAAVDASPGAATPSPPPADVGASRAPAAAPAPNARAALAASTALSLAIEVDNVFDGSGYSGTWHQRLSPAPANQLTYRAEQRADRVLVTPSSALHAPGAAIAAGKSVAQALQWQLPRLSLRIENPTTSALGITALEVRVQRSEPDRGALVFVPSETSAMLELENLGWGKAKAPELKLGFAPASEYDAIDPLAAATSATLKLDDFDESLRVALKDRAPAALGNAAATVFGSLSYATEAGEKHVLPFKALAHFDRALAQRRWRPRFFHHVLLPAGKTGVTSLPLALSVGPQRSAQVKLRVGSDRSARHEIVLELKGVDGALLASQLVELQIFVPRADAAAIASTPSPLKVLGSLSQ
jgi:hypothetical protein